MTIKATSALSILAIWVATITGIVVAGGGSPVIIFAFLATAAVGISAWRRLGLSRLIAIAGMWSSVAIGMGGHTNNWWISIFAFLSTGAVVYSLMRRDDVMIGVGVAAAWLAVGIASAKFDGAAWMCIFAFLTTGALSNTRGDSARGLSAILWWGIVLGVVLVGGASWAWLSIPAFILTAASLGLGDFRFPRALEWDLFDRDDDGDRVR